MKIENILIRVALFELSTFLFISGLSLMAGGITEVQSIGAFLFLNSLALIIFTVVFDFKE